MAGMRDTVTHTFQKRIANPVMRRLPFQTLLETTGRTSGQPRRTPLGGRRIGDQFWFVSEFGERSQYIRNIKADPHVRVRLRGRWGTRASPTCCPKTIRASGYGNSPSSTASVSAHSAPTCSPCGWT